MSQTLPADVIEIDLKPDARPARLDPLPAPEPESEAPDASPAGTLGEAVVQMLEDMEEQEMAENSVKALSHDLGLLCDYLGGEKRVADIHDEDLAAFVTWLEREREVPSSRRTLARRISSVRTLFRWLTQMEFIARDPALDLRQVQGELYLPTILDNREVRMLMQKASDMFWNFRHPDARPLLLLNLLIQTGMKKQECLRLEYADFKFASHHHGTVRIAYPQHSPANRSRTLPLSGSVQNYLEEYRRQYGNEADAGQLLFNCTGRNLEYVLEDLGKSALASSVKVGFEVLRWTCAINDARRGMSDSQLQDKLGLSNVAWRETRAKIIALL